jgi:hypothetical protein
MSPLILCRAASVCFLIIPSMKPRLGLVVLVPAAPGSSCARQLARSS